MTSAAPKPSAGEHVKENRLRTGRPSRWTPYDDYVALQAERDLLRERLADLVEVADVSFRNNLGHMLSHEDTVLESARAALAKVRP